MTNTYEIITDNLALPRGARFDVEPGPIEAGQLAMIEIGDRQTIGRYYPDVAGCDWITQPDLIIQVDGKIPVSVVGPVMQIC